VAVIGNGLIDCKSTSITDHPASATRKLPRGRARGSSEIGIDGIVEGPMPRNGYANAKCALGGKVDNVSSG